MRKNFILIAGLLFLLQFGFSQFVSQTTVENFDGTGISFTASPSNTWKKDANYYKSYPNAYLGEVPKVIGEVSYLTSSPGYDFRTDMLGYVRLKFHHICKISPKDTAWIEYKIGGGTWNAVPRECYLGDQGRISGPLGFAGFTAASYPEWLVNDSLAMPSQSWWQEETFELSTATGYENVEIRFVLKRGKTEGTQIAYGWLIDSVEMFASQREWRDPYIRFHAGCPHGILTTAGPFPINASIRTNTSRNLAQPWLHWTVVRNSVTTTDSMQMTAYSGDTLWNAALPPFPESSVVNYRITAVDSFGNTATVTDSFSITRPAGIYYNNSASLDKFITPSVATAVLGGVPQPVKVQLRNRGLKDLTEAKIHWMVNGSLHSSSPITWNNDTLYWDYYREVSLGDYMPTAGNFDTIVAWVSMPNGIVDSLTVDDTIQIISYACDGNTMGTYTCGTGGYFPDWSSFLTLLQNCFPTGDVTVEFLSDTFSQTLDLTDINNYMNGHTLTLTSKAGVADSVVFNPGGDGITLANSSNIVIKNLSINKSNGTGISFSNSTPCNNILIRDCKISFSGTSGTAISRIGVDGALTVNNVRFIHNTITGGNIGINFSGSPAMGANSICDSNIITDINAGGITLTRLGCNSISYNTIVSRGTVPDVWDGIYLTGCSGDVIGNHVRMRAGYIGSGSTGRSTGLRLASHNYGFSDTALVCNNEMILFAKGTSEAITGICISLMDARVKFLYNSLYYSGSKPMLGINLETKESGMLKYNNIVLNGSDPVQYPIKLPYADLPDYEVEHNNLYSPSGAMISYEGNSQMTCYTLEDIQILYPYDQNSFSQLPVYSNLTQNLEQSNYIGFIPANRLPEVSYDITRTARSAVTQVGCHNGVVENVDAALENIVDLQKNYSLGQQEVLKVQVFNMGATVVDTIVLHWEIRGVPQTPVVWTKGLPSCARDTITLDAITWIPSGIWNVKVYIENIGNLADVNKANDTLAAEVVVCDGEMRGRYIIGGVSPDFNSLDEALTALSSCRMDSNTTFAFAAGTYPAIELLNLANYTNGHALTLTSADNEADSVIIETNGTAIRLHNSDNIVLQKLTLTTDGASGNCYGVQFTEGCSNILIRDCKINLHLSNLGAFGIRTDLSSAVRKTVDNIHIINNEIYGGNHGISAAYMNNLWIDSNTLTNQYQRGIDIASTAAIKSVSANTILKLNYRNTHWTGIHLATRTDASIIGNRIYATDSTMAARYVRGIQYIGAFADPPINLFIANNEIILNKSGIGSSASCGIYTECYNAASTVTMMFNSIYGKGTESINGIYLANHTHNYKAEIKYNNISTSGYPIYLIGEANLPLWDIDYNNMYTSGIGIGYVGEAKNTLQAWQATVTSDRNSFSVEPDYINPDSILQQSSYAGFAPLAPRVEVPDDIDGNSRGNMTNIGCYQGTFHAADAALTGIIDLQSNAYIGSTDTVRVVLTNYGTSMLDSITVTWTIGGGNPQAKSFPLSLLSAQTDTLALGLISYSTVEDITVRVYISSLGLHTDENLTNDTVENVVYACQGTLNGTYTIGTHFPSLDIALKTICKCGIRGNVTLLLPAGEYDPIDLTNFTDYMGSYTLTLASVSGNANEVTIAGRDNDVAGITLKNSNNIVIRGLTVKMNKANNRHTVHFTGTCENVLIEDCRLLVSSTAYNNIYTEDRNNSIYNNIQIINDTIEGGYYGFYLSQGNNNVCDGNIFKNGRYGGVWIEKASHFKNISNNWITIDSTIGFDDTWYGIRLYESGAEVYGNRIHAYAASNAGGIYGIFHGTSTRPTLIYNNEIIAKTSRAGSSSMFGTRIYSGICLNGEIRNTKVLFNSVYFDGANLSAGMYVDLDILQSLEVKYNNFYVKHTGGYAIYQRYQYNASWGDFDYNNMYAPTNIGYSGSVKADIAAWRATVTSDLHSVKINPQFNNQPGSLRCQDNDSLLVPHYAGIDRDIAGRPRFETTKMGAYTVNPVAEDLSLTKVAYTKAVLNQTFDIVAEAANMGVAAINSARLNWSINGGQPQGSILWTASSPLLTDETEEITVGSILFDGTPVNIKVWLEEINGGINPVTDNDTVTAIITTGQLAWFTDPIVPENIYETEFDVYAVILETSGALVNQPVPKLHIQSVLGTHVEYDTLDMTFSGGKWSAHVPTQRYGTTVTYSLHFTDTVNNSLTISDQTHIGFQEGNIPYAYENLSLLLFHGLDFGNTDCLPDFTQLSIDVVNTGNTAVDFSQNSLNLHFRLSIPYTLAWDTVINTGILNAREKLTVNLDDRFQIHIASHYDILAYMDATDTLNYDDTLVYDYVSGRFPLPIDEDFTAPQSMNDLFTLNRKVGTSQWSPVSAGSGNDADVTPVHGDGVLAFRGSPGAVATLYTRQLDLSQTIDPKLTFWYFHDTAPGRDYTDVRITVDGGATYTPLITVEKQAGTRGWEDYSIMLPPVARNTCVFIAFEAMEWDRNGSTWQYIDRILVTSSQNLSLDAMLLPQVSACALTGHELKVILRNTTSQQVDFTKAPMELHLDITGALNNKIIYPLTGTMEGLQIDTITLATNVDFTTPGDYRFNAYISSLAGDFNRTDDSVTNNITINPKFEIEIEKLSGTKPATAEFEYFQKVTIKNTGTVIWNYLLLV